MVVNNFNSVAGIYENVGVKSRLAVRLKGLAPNTQAIGARFSLRGGSLIQTKELTAGGRYLSGDWPMAVFATPTNASEIEVAWPSGKFSVVTAALPNKLYELSEGDATSMSQRTVAVKPALMFQDVSALLKHSHVETPFDDFGQQQLLPHRFSQMGPGIAWFDFDSDGWEDLIIGAGRGGKPAFYRNDHHGSFTLLPNASSAVADQCGLLGWQTDGVNRILVAQSNYEGAGRDIASVIAYSTEAGLRESALINGQTAAVGPLAMADVDGDGELDLFVGNRLIPGHFPESSLSRLYRNQAGKFHLDRVHSQSLASAGMVSGAVFSDLDGDGKPELFLACDCGPIRVFHFRKGGFEEKTESLVLAG